MRHLVIAFISVLLLAGCRETPRAAVDLKPQGQRLDARTIVLLQEAREALAERDFERVQLSLEHAERYNRGIPEIRFLRGHVALAVNRLDDARAAFRGIVDEFPTYAAAWHSLGDVVYAEGRYREALGYYFRETEHNPTPQTWFNIGSAYRSLDRPDSARTAYERSLALDPSFALALQGMAELEELAGSYESALEFARKALESQPDNHAHRYMVGSILFRTGRLTEAEEMLRSALERAPWDHSTLYTLGQVLQRLGRPDEAEEMLSRAADARDSDSELRTAKRKAQRMQEDPEGLVRYASELIRAGRLEEALDQFKMALALDPSDLMVRQNIAALHLQQGRIDEAISICSAIVRRDSSRVGAWVILSAAYARMGQQDRSKEAWARAVAIDPNHPTIKQALGRR